MSNPRRWLITGVSSGIGRAIAEAALDRGDAVVGCARKEAGVAGFASTSERATGIQLDVTRPDDIQQAVDRALADGPLDVVVNNAGQSLFGAFEEVSLPELKSLFDVNVFGPWLVAQAVLPHFRERGKGHLVHISSGMGLVSMPGLSAYSATKFALEGFSEGLAAEVAQFGIKLLLVEPGAVAGKFISHGTGETATRLPEYEWLSGRGKEPLQSYYEQVTTTPEQVAEAILAAIDNPEQSLRLVVGEDMRETVRMKAEQLKSSV